jgi:hypothetical protein
MSELEVNGGDDNNSKGWFKSLNPSVVGFCIPLAVVGFYALLGWLDDTTELLPRHDDSMNVCFCLAGLVAILLAVIVAIKSKGKSLWLRIRLIVPISLIGAIGVGLLSVRLVDLAYGWLDFPSQKTQTFQTLLLISRAYQTHGKGASHDIQTTPIWSDMNVTESDYDFMLRNRRPGDTSHNPDEISSKGYFCAKVTMQRSGDSFRVMHAGSGTLPSGTVIICPQFQVPVPN